MYLLSKTVFYNIDGKNYINDIPPPYNIVRCNVARQKVKRPTLLCKSNAFAI